MQNKPRYLTVNKNKFDKKTPFSFDIEEITKEDIPEEYFWSVIDYNISGKDDLHLLIHNEVISYFDFYRYLDSHSKDYIKDTENDIVFYFEIKVFRIVNKKKEEVQTLYAKALNFNTEYDYRLIRSVEDLLKEIEPLKNTEYMMALDFETTGLNPEEDSIVGYSFATTKDLKKSYYVPINHIDEYKEFNLPKQEALGILFNLVKNATHVYLHNLRFDIRFFEYAGFDFSEIDNLYDTMFLTKYVDPDEKESRLKQLEKYYLGVYRPDLESTLKILGDKEKSFDFSRINPKLGYYYAAQDSLSTLLIGLNTLEFYHEFGLSAQLDRALIYPLMKAENTLIRVDLDYLKEQIDLIEPRLQEIETKLKELVGDINWNSPAQKVALFESFNLDTEHYTDKGNMKTGVNEVNQMIQKMRNQNKQIPEFLLYLEERSMLDKLHGTFFKSLYTQALERDGLVRLNYRLANTATGRLSSGQELF